MKETDELNGVVVQSLSCVQLFVSSWTAPCQALLSFTISLSFLRLMSIESVMPSSHLILCCPLLLLLSIFPSIRVFPNELALWVAKILERHFQQHPVGVYLGKILSKLVWWGVKMKLVLTCLKLAYMEFQSSVSFWQFWHRGSEMPVSLQKQKSVCCPVIPTHLLLLSWLFCYWCIYCTNTS